MNKVEGVHANGSFDYKRRLVGGRSQHDHLLSLCLSLVLLLAFWGEMGGRSGCGEWTRKKLFSLCLGEPILCYIIVGLDSQSRGR